MLETNDLAIGYGDKILVSKISLQIGAGETILLCGSNGCGKSTLLKTLAGHLRPLSGTLSYQKEDSPQIMLVPTHIPRVSGFTVKEFILTACNQETGLFGKPTKQLERRIHDSLELLQMGNYQDLDISHLSDGEFQKVTIAMGLARNADILLLDEPSAFLDVDNRISVLQTIRNLAEETQKTFLFSSHDLNESLKVCTRIWGITRQGEFMDTQNSCRQEDLLRACFKNYYSYL